MEIEDSVLDDVRNKLGPLQTLVDLVEKLQDKSLPTELANNITENYIPDLLVKSKESIKYIKEL